MIESLGVMLDCPEVDAEVHSSVRPGSSAVHTRPDNNPKGIAMPKDTGAGMTLLSARLYLNVLVPRGWETRHLPRHAYGLPFVH